MDKIEVVIVTGKSGAGKTQAMAMFENMEYSCIDNYPVALLEEFGEMLRKPSRYHKIAMAVSLPDAIEAIRILSNMDWIELTVVFLDCEDYVLLSRYKQTRRTHPLVISNICISLEDAIRYENEIAEPVSKMANIMLDTTLLKPSKLQHRLENYFYKKPHNIFRITFISFGYKHGIPKDADLLIDVRFLPNPFYIEKLRPQTGNDSAVYNYVMEKEETKIFIKNTKEYLDYLLKEYAGEGRKQITIGIGCTGGQHRSVTLTNYFADYYAKYYQVNRLHRDAHH